MKVWLRFVFFFLLLCALASNFYGCGKKPGDGSQQYTKLELMLLAANDYIDEFTYISGWYNREYPTDPNGTHYNSCGVAYSYYSTDPPGYFEAKIDSSDDGVTRWCDYSPYRPAAGRWDVDDGYWTGTYCHALVYNCCAFAGYSFTSDSMYLAGVNAWEDPSIGSIFEDSSQIQVGDIILVDWDANDTCDHIGVVSDTSTYNSEGHGYKDCKIIQALGWYADPFFFKAVEIKIYHLWDSDLYPNLTVKFLRLNDE